MTELSADPVVDKVAVYTIDAITGLPVAQESINGAVPVTVSSSSITPPEEQYVPFTGVVGVNTGDQVYLSTDVSVFNTHIIECTAGTVDVLGSVDGTNFNATPVAVLLVDDVTTGGGLKVVAIPAGKIGVLSGKYKAIKVRQSGATASNARGGHGVI